jgi:alkylation response protein AidB-like acyl-CoA dehydrogenase
MTARLIDRRDLDFLLFQWLGVERLFEREAFEGHSRETTDALLDLSAELAEDAFLSHYKLSDKQEPDLTEDGVRVLPQVREALAAFADAGLKAGPFKAETGGLLLPRVLYSASMGHFMAASIGTAAYAMLSIGNSHLLEAFGTPAQLDAFVTPQLEGRATGTMCLSEPQAGSSLADITTRAEADGEDGLGRRFRLAGNKMWISGGDHDAADNIVHLVLAKTPGPDGKLIPGTRGISLFVVPKILPEGIEGGGERNDVVVAGLNHKMGYRATSNCLLNFGEGARYRPAGKAGAVGYLIGEIGQGLPIMFHMMNEARIDVGLGAAALGYRGYLLAVDYARERLQGRPLGAKDPTAPQTAIIEHPDVKRMLLAAKSYAEGSLALILYSALLVDEQHSAASAEERADAAALLGLLTPVAKTWPSEWALQANDIAIQVHGGYGYTRDFDVEQLYRDNRLNPIHEGTTGIQAMDLLGRKILRDNGQGMGVLKARIAATLARAQDGPFASQASRLKAAWDEIDGVLEVLRADGDPARTMWNATPFLFAFAHAVSAWLWLDQAVAAQSSSDEMLRTGKTHACRYFFDFELPKTTAWLSAVKAGSDATATMPSEAF